MRAMVLAAGLGTRLRPLTYELPKPMVPVLDRPVMAHILDLLETHGFDDVIANLHYFPDTIRDHFGDRLSYRYEEELLGTAGRRAQLRRLPDSGRGVPDHLRRRAHRHRPAPRSPSAIGAPAVSPRWRSSGCPTRASTASSCTTPTAASRAFRRSLSRRMRSRTSATAASTSSSPRSSTTSRPSRSSTGPRTCSRACSRPTSRSTSTSSTNTGTMWARWTSSSRGRSTRSRVRCRCRSPARRSPRACGPARARASTGWPTSSPRCGSAPTSRSPPMSGSRARWRSATARASARVPRSRTRSSCRGPRSRPGAILIGAIAGHTGILASLRRS